MSLFRHKHEIETGRTSSAGNEILGFQPDGKVIVPEDHAKQQATWESIAHKAAKVVSFTDLAGHEKYLKVRNVTHSYASCRGVTDVIASGQTTLAGLTGTAPDFVLLILGANAGLIGMSKVSALKVLPVMLFLTSSNRNTSRSRWHCHYPSRVSSPKSTQRRLKCTSRLSSSLSKSSDLPAAGRSLYS